MDAPPLYISQYSGTRTDPLFLATSSLVTTSCCSRASSSIVIRKLGHFMTYYLPASVSLVYFPTGLYITSQRTAHTVESMSVTFGPLRRRPLYEAYRQFTHGGNYWPDLYLLERWNQQIQPVVYRGEVYNGYELLRRVGTWCWLTKDLITRSREFLTIKFLPRDGNGELDIFRYITKHCRSPFVSTLRDSFTIPHHLSKSTSAYTKDFRQIFFQALVYPATETCLGRCADVTENHDNNPDIPFTLQRRQTYIRQVVEGLCDLHRIGVVHDIHLGNVALALPSDKHLEDLLERPPLEHEILLKSGEPPPPWMPCRSTEPEDIGFTPSGVRLIDFGYSIIPERGASYAADKFPKGTWPPPELLAGQRGTDRPFKADSWYLADMPHFAYRLLGCDDEGLLDEYRISIEMLEQGKDEFFQELPEEIRSKYLPILLGLLKFDPKERLSVPEVLRRIRNLEV
ncbi:Protein kinase-like domain [Cordyceps javanica]|uniref:Protein kinase-like domain n=1 Tax=Cordyceps javanica TaxID=43265 RepID=A0A545UKF0_9HYPO|nr:Protein kinase-like domain [Cordyceps javanica]